MMLECAFKGANDLEVHRSSVRSSTTMMKRNLYIVDRGSYCTTGAPKDTGGRARARGQQALLGGSDRSARFNAPCQEGRAPVVARAAPR